eukprot:366230-Chlamydomonas_euryale.AAC.1
MGGDASQVQVPPPWAEPRPVPPRCECPGRVRNAAPHSACAGQQPCPGSAAHTKGCWAHSCRCLPGPVSQSKPSAITAPPHLPPHPAPLLQGYQARESLCTPGGGTQFSLYLVTHLAPHPIPPLRDIKPENLLFTATGVLKVGDFGLSINFELERPVTRVGTLDYMVRLIPRS